MAVKLGCYEHYSPHARGYPYMSVRLDWYEQYSPLARG